MNQELLQACQAATLTHRQERDLGKFVNAVCDRLTYLNDKSGVIMHDDQRQAATLSIWQALSRGKYDPAKSDASITTYMVSVGNNSIKSMFPKTEKRKWYESLIHLNRDAALKKQDNSSTSDHAGGLIQGECLDSPYAYILGKTPHAYQRRGMFLHSDTVETGDAVQQAVVLLRATYVFDDVNSRVLEDATAGKKTALISSELGLQLREVQRILREAKRRTLLLHELLQTFSFVDLFCVIIRIQTEGCRVLDMIKRRSLVPVFFQLLTHGTTDTVKLPQNAVCYRSQGLNIDLENITVTEDNASDVGTRADTGDSDNRDDYLDEDPEDIMTFETFKHLFSGMFPGMHAIKEIKKSEWCQAFLRNCPRVHSSAKPMIRLYRGYVEYYKNNVTRLESKTVGRRPAAKTRTDIQFTARGKPYVKSVDTLFDYESYRDLFTKKLQNAGLQDIVIVHPGEKSTQYVIYVDNETLTEYYESIGMEWAAVAREESGETYVPVMTLYNPHVASTKYRPDRLWLTTGFDISKLEIDGPGRITRTLVRRKFSINRHRFKFAGSYVYESTVHTLFDRLVANTGDAYQAISAFTKPKDDGPVNTKNLFVMGV